MQSRRCLIPADAFYEWARKGSEKAAFCVTMADDSIFAFAGIWDRWIVIRSSKPRVFFAVNSDIGANLITRADCLPPFAKGRAIQGHAATDDSYEPAAWFEPQQSLLNVPSTISRAMAGNSPASC
jgi:hypothetical protein